jgi:DNA modification methylase
VTPYYDAAGVTIYHGDCREVLPTLDLVVAATVTSPPYNTLGSRIPKKPTGMHSVNQWMAGVTTGGYADDLDDDAYIEWQVDVAGAVRAVTRPGGAFFYNHKVRYRDRIPVHPIDLVRRFVGWNLRQELIWDRQGAVAFNARMFAPSDERIYWLIRDDADFTWNQEAAGFLTVWPMNPLHEVKGHPCPYPVAIPKRCITSATAPGDIVLDPFMGSGTTIRAAKDLGRRAIGIEIEERFCEVAARRAAQEVLDLWAG